MNAIIQLLNGLLAIIKRAMAKQEQKRHDETIEKIENNAGEFLAGHFGRVPGSTIDHNADKASPRRDGTD